MKKRTDILQLFLAEGLAKGLNVLMPLTLAYFISVTDFAKVSIFIIAEFVLLEVVLFGQQHSVLKGKNFNDCLAVVNKIWITAAPLIIFFSLISDVEIYQSAILVLIVYFAAHNKLLSTYFRAEDNFRKYNEIRIVETSLRYTLVCGLVYLSDNLNGYLIAVLISTCATYCIFSKDRPFRGLNLRLTDEQMGNLKYGFGLAVFSISGVLYTIWDKLIVNKLLEEQDFSVYNLTSTIGMSPFFFVAVVGLMRTPKIYAATSTEELLGRLKAFVFLSFSGMSIVFFLLYLFIYPFFISFYDDEYEKGFDYLYLFYFVLCLQLVQNTFVYYFASIRKTSNLPWITLIGLTVMVLTSSFLVRYFGEEGAIYSILLAEGIVIACFTYLFGRVRG